MGKMDARKLDRKSREALRIRGVKAVHSGQSPEEVAKTLGIHRSTMYSWLSKYSEGGFDNLKRNPSPGRPPIIKAAM